MKQIKDLTREEKISFLELLQQGDIDPTEITDTEVIIVSDLKDAFAGLMAQLAGGRVVFTGEARESITKTVETIQKLRNGDGEDVQGMQEFLNDKFGKQS
jgi:hypothetical protein